MEALFKVLHDCFVAEYLSFVVSVWMQGIVKCTLHWEVCFVRFTWYIVIFKLVLFTF